MYNYGIENFLEQIRTNNFLSFNFLRAQFSYFSVKKIPKKFCEIRSVDSKIRNSKKCAPFDLDLPFNDILTKFTVTF